MSAYIRTNRNSYQNRNINIGRKYSRRPRGSKGIPYIPVIDPGPNPDEDTIYSEPEPTPEPTPDIYPYNTTDKFIFYQGHWIDNPNYIGNTNNNNSANLTDGNTGGQKTVIDYLFGGSNTNPVNTTDKYIFQGGHWIPNPNYKNASVIYTTNILTANYGPKTNNARGVSSTTGHQQSVIDNLFGSVNKQGVYKPKVYKF